MKKIWQIELSRALKGKSFYISLIIGSIITFSHFLMYVVPAYRELSAYVERARGIYYPSWLFSSWIGGNSYSVQSFLFLLLIPVLAVMPYGGSFFQDLTQGFAKNICIRTSKKNYVFSKIAAVFCSGGIAVVLPLFLNFMLSALLLPSMKPEPATFNQPINDSSMMADIYFSHPFLYVFIFFGIIFLFSGLIACCSLPLSYLFEHQFIVVLAPFLINLFVYSLFNLLDIELWSPIEFLNPANAHNSSAILIVGALLLIGVLFGYVHKGAKNDIY